MKLATLVHFHPQKTSYETSKRPFRIVNDIHRWIFTLTCAIRKFHSRGCFVFEVTRVVLFTTNCRIQHKRFYISFYIYLGKSIHTYQCTNRTNIFSSLKTKIRYTPPTISIRISCKINIQPPVISVRCEMKSVETMRGKNTAGFFGLPKSVHQLQVFHSALMKGDELISVVL